MKHRQIAVLLAAAVAVSTASGAFAQGTAAAYPAKPLRFVIPFSPGGTPDLQLRILDERLTQRLGQPLVHDYRPGAAGNIGMEIVARAPADGYTLIIATVGTWAVNPHLYALPYDVLNDFAPIIHVATTPAVLVVHPSVPARTVQELIALARKRPGELNYGSTGVGGFGHMCAELFSAMTQTRMTHISYKGSAPALADLLGGHIQVLFNSAVVTVPQIADGRLRALATTGATRLSILPDVPTVAEAGVPGYENSTWTGIAAPARTPAAIVARLNQEFAAALALPEVRERYAASGSAVTGGTPEHFRAYLKAELEKFGKLIRQAGIKPVAG